METVKRLLTVLRTGRVIPLLSVTVFAVSPAYGVAKVVTAMHLRWGAFKMALSSCTLSGSLLAAFFVDQFLEPQPQCPPKR